MRGLQLHMTGDTRQDVITIEYNGFLVAENLAGRLEADAIAFLLSGLTVDGHRCEELHLKNVPSGLEKSVRASGFRFREVQRKPSWRIDLAAIRAAGNQYLGCLSANTRQQIRRAMRLYEKRGRLEIARARDVAEALNFLEGLKELHQRYWTGRGEPGAFAFPFFAGFQSRLIQTCVDHGTVELLRVSAGDDVIGYFYNLVYRGHVYQYQSGFRYEADPRLKPGLVSHCLCIERHLGEGSLVYDFMAGDARYKANLARPGPEMVYLLAARPTWPLQLENALHGMKRSLGGLSRRLRAASSIRCLALLHQHPIEIGDRACRPSSSGTRGSQPRVAAASAMSGQRCSGSSCGSGAVHDARPRAGQPRSPARPVRAPVISCGLPRLTGPVTSSRSPSAGSSPSIRSST